MRNRFEEQLALLNNELITMGALCEEGINACVKYFIDNDISMREDTIDTNKQIDQKERDIERLCMKLLMQQQPVATDLRVISSAMKMIFDMKRIGDQALEIAEIVKHAKNNLENKTHISDMAKATIAMVTQSVDSFVKKDILLAKAVIKNDDEVDRLFNKVKNDLIMAVQQSRDDLEELINLLLIAKYFERIGDHAENIARWVIFSITGHHAGIS